MPLPVQKLREAILQILYSKDYQAEPCEIISLLMKELKASRSSISEASARADQVAECMGEIDPLIEAQSTEYRLERISSVEKWILRLGLYELLFEKSLPFKVVISEAIRLCRKFGTPESAEFINAILDGVYKAHASKIPDGAETI